MLAVLNDLAAVEAWANDVLDDDAMTAYDDRLPTHSVRSQMLCLAGEVQRLRAEHEVDAVALRLACAGHGEVRDDVEELPRVWRSAARVLVAEVEAHR